MFNQVAMLCCFCARLFAKVHPRPRVKCETYVDYDNDYDNGLSVTVIKPVWDSVGEEDRTSETSSAELYEIEMEMRRISCDAVRLALNQAFGVRVKLRCVQLGATTLFYDSGTAAKDDYDLVFGEFAPFGSLWLSVL